jgi:hypothetical protein
MTQATNFVYEPGEHETEKASNSYLMSLIAVIAGLPLPIINLLATLIFFMGNRKGTFFVRWHCTQGLLSQLSLFFINTAAVWWTLSIIFGSGQITNLYIAYMFTIIIVNAFEFIANIYAAVQTRKGQHVQFWFYGPLTDLICKP